MSTGLQARIYDPLWLLARQWQTGEFRGEDNGSPAAAQWRAECAPLTRYQPGFMTAGASVEGQSFDRKSIPLETMVERERARPGEDVAEKLRFAVEAGQHFLRMLDQQSTSKNYHELFKTKFAFAPLTFEQRAEMDGDSLSFIDLVGPRVPDGRKLYAKLNVPLRPAPPTFPKWPADIAIAVVDVPKVQAAATAWLDWYDRLITEPGGVNPSWSSERMEYGFSVGARFASGEKVLTAQEYFSGHVDWHDFSVNPGASLKANNDPLTTMITRTTMPAPVSYKGMPAPRFWQFEDSRVDFGSVDAGPEDLARMLLVEFAISYGNDWFVIPLDLEVGTLCRTHSLIITNTFGERFLVRSSSEAGSRFSDWRMFQLSSMRQPGAAPPVSDSNLFMLAPAVMNTLESRPIEEVLFLRDEMANMAWGVERIIESAIEQPLNRFEQQRYPEPPQPNQSNEMLKYQLATQAPDNWVPLLPVQSSAGLRLKRGKVLKPDGSQVLVGAKGDILNPPGSNGNGLAIFEEEIPREGVRVTRTYQLARWQDGSTHLWIGRKKIVGRGEGSSGLRFDITTPSEISDTQ
jgi:hypothetical protein